MARGAAVTRTAVQTVKPITDSSVRETMDLTSSHIDDTNAGWSGRSEKNFQLNSATNLARWQNLRRRRLAARQAVRPVPSAQVSSDLSETARFARPHTPDEPAAKRRPLPCSRSAIL